MMRHGDPHDDPSAKRRPKRELSLDILGIEDVLELLLRDIQRVGGQSEWARQTGVPRTQINRALNGRRMPTSQLCRALELEWVIVRHVEGKDGQQQPIIMEKRDLLLILNVEIEKVGSITAWCERTGFNRTYLSQVLNNIRPASSKLIGAVNLAEVLVRASKSATVKGRRKKGSSGKRHPHARWPTS
jgi:DNA-binding transcriptional regulator YdaS (Cro superfamily)